jgi:hypothetical protein
MIIVVASAWLRPCVTGIIVVASAWLRPCATGIIVVASAWLRACATGTIVVASIRLGPVTEQTNLWRVRREADDQVQMIRVRRFQQVGHRRLRRRVWMRVVETEHGQAPRAGLTPRRDVRLRLDLESVRVVRAIRRADRLGNRGLVAQQEPAALRRLRLARVRDDDVDRAAGDANRYKASTAMAMPMPPPMQREATP